MWFKKFNILFFLVFLLFSTSAIAHTSFIFNVGRPVYYPAPVYYAPPTIVRNVVWVSAHSEGGYWIPGHYVEYVAPRPEMVWVGERYYRRRGYW